MIAIEFRAHIILEKIEIESSDKEKMKDAKRAKAIFKERGHRFKKS